jgi:hypothetical protein
MVRPFIDRLKLASALDWNYIHQPGGAKALAELLTIMAKELDATRRSDA